MTNVLFFQKKVLHLFRLAKGKLRRFYFKISGMKEVT